MSVFERQKAFFETGVTRDYGARVTCLKKLRSLLHEYEQELSEALKLDLGRSSFEAFAAEIGASLKEITYTLAYLKKWMTPSKVSTSIVNFPSTGKIIYEPYGQVLIIAPWNYPLYLAMSPLIGALAAGNTAIIKMSEISTHTSKVVAKMINNNFDENFIKVVEGGVSETAELLALPFNYIFFTGSTQVGKIVMRAASEHLTPVTLELGGKSPCIIDQDMNLEVATKRMIWGKFFNAGQTCVAPDYLYIHEDHYEKFQELFKKYVSELYTDNPKLSDDYGRIVNKSHFERLTNLIDTKKVLVGGSHDAALRYIEPTLVGEFSWDDKIMQEEIFGPILPVKKFSDLNTVISEINKKPKPLALYLFTSNAQNRKKVLNECSFGGGCVNDTIVHLVEDELPFGGVGASGMGSYHGRKSFLTFSHQKSILMRESWYDNPLRYAPYKGKLKFLKLLFK